jgi:hypothetical protein
LVRPQNDGHFSGDFDAGRVLIEARALSPEPSALWPTSALVSVLAKVARSFPYSLDGSELQLRRIVDGTTALALLGRRGLDVRELLSFGLAPMLNSAIGVSLSIKGDSRSTDWPGSEQWRDLAERSGASSIDLMSRGGNDSFLHVVLKWIQTSEPIDILKWTPPTSAKVDGTISEDPAVACEYRWFVTRLAQTFLDEWPTDALELEYRFARGEWRPSHVPTGLLSERLESPEAVAHAIAERTIKGSGSYGSEAVATLTQRAVDFIASGRVDLAANAFATARSMAPQDADFANNYGFCLLPSDPQSALDAFYESRRLGRSDAILSANIGLALFRSDAAQDALTELESGYQQALTGDTRAYLWVGGHDELTMETVRVRAYICDLGLAASTLIGSDESIALWQTRRESEGEES